MDDALVIIFGFGLLFVFVWVLNRLGAGRGGLSKENKQLSYKHKDFLMTHAEHDFFKKLDLAVGDLYYIFPQIHLSSIVDHSVVGQNWKGALNHIDRKSVDFILCDKDFCKPLLAIELDDYSHKREDRKIRDAEAERILQQAKLPLLRFANGSEESEKIKEKINQALSI